MKIITRIRVSLYCRRVMNRFLPVFLVYMILLFVSANAWSRVFDVRHTPFSHYGSYMAVMLEDDPATGEEGFYIRDTGYSWTVDAFFALAHEYLREN